jgi:hypothetical protein
VLFVYARNIVSTVNLDCKLELKSIALQARNAEYNPKASYVSQLSFTYIYICPSHIVLLHQNLQEGWPGFCLVVEFGFLSGPERLGWSIRYSTNITIEANHLCTTFCYLRSIIDNKIINLHAWYVVMLVGLFSAVLMFVIWTFAAFCCCDYEDPRTKDNCTYFCIWQDGMFLLLHVVLLSSLVAVAS